MEVRCGRTMRVWHAYIYKTTRHGTKSETEEAETLDVVNACLSTYLLPSFSNVGKSSVFFFSPYVPFGCSLKPRASL